MGISSDGDERLLRAMKIRMKLDLSTTTDLSQLLIMHPINIQDIIHIATKLRNRYLNTSLLLQMGNMVVSVTHILMLLSEVPKEVHGLVLSDVDPEDRQNYASFVKITEQRVMQALESHIADSKATVMYLVLCKQITASFLDVNLQPIERIYKIWHAVYFFRCWRKWLKLNNYSIDQHFLSNNAYSCVEINAHALIHIIVSLRMKQENEYFLPELFSSQPCEHTFRQMRSMGTANYTKINFNLNELLHMIARVEIMNKVVYSCKEITFPRVELKSHIEEQIAHNNLPNNEDILNAMKRAQCDALKNAAQFGMHFNENDIKTCELQVRVHQNLDQNEETIIDEDCSDLFEQFAEFDECRHVNEEDKFVEVIDPDGSTRNLRKSTLVWLLCDSRDKLSSDRLKRVQSSSGNSGTKSKRFKPNSSAVLGVSLPIFKAEELEIGEWAIFQHPYSHSKGRCEVSDVTGHDFMEQFIIGIVVGFRLATRKKSGEMKHQKQYKLKFAPTNTLDSSEQNCLQVLCLWYSCDQTGNLHLIQNKTQESIYIKNYVATMKSPTTRRCEVSGNITYVLPFEYAQLKSGLFEFVSQSSPGTSQTCVL